MTKFASEVRNALVEIDRRRAEQVAREREARETASRKLAARRNAVRQLTVAYKEVFTGAAAASQDRLEVQILSSPVGSDCRLRWSARDEGIMAVLDSDAGTITWHRISEETHQSTDEDPLTASKERAQERVLEFVRKGPP